MGSTVKKIALLSGGGDCPGLNAVIRTITKTAISKYGYEVIGFVYGYRGLYHNNYVELTEESVEDIYKEGGTIMAKAVEFVNIKLTSVCHRPHRN